MIVVHKIVWGFCYLLSLLPFWCLYLFSDFMYLIVFHCVRYRRKVVSRNLRNSFPQKTGHHPSGWCPVFSKISFQI